MRRYSEFFLFREFLFSRWPGLYVPPIPPKKKIGAKHDKFIEERLYFLDRFIKEIAVLPYLYESDEFQVFVR